MFEKREVEYAYCNDARLATRDVCKASCEAMDRPGSTGWTLASIPTVQHNNELVNMINERYPGARADDKFNLFWIGLSDPEKQLHYRWDDPAFVVNYNNFTWTDGVKRY